MEYRVLLACASASSPGDRRATLLSLLDGPIDWSHLIASAVPHRLTSLAYWHLNELCRDQVPPEALAALRERFLANAASTLRLSAELAKVVEMLERDGIRAVALKGPALAESVYEAPAAREFSDLDLLVERSNVVPALQSLSALGYPSPRRDWQTVQARILERRYNHGVERENGPGLVEVHWDLLPGWFGVHMPPPASWERLVAVRVHGRSIPSLGPEDLLVSLCVHGCRHRWTSLGWLADVARVVHKHPDLDWDLVERDYREPLFRRMVAVGLIGAHDILGGPVPAQVLRRARLDPVPLRLAGEVERLMFDHRNRPESRLRSASFQLQLEGDWRQRIRYSWRRTGWFATRLAAPWLPLRF